MEKLIKLNKSIIPALDLKTTTKLEEVVATTCEHPAISGYKIGFMLVGRYGMYKVMDIIRGHTDKPVIYDHQKAGTDVPHTGKGFAELCAEGGVNAVIFFPLSGPVTAKEWIQNSLDVGLHVIVGGKMTHDGFVRREGGYLDDNDSFKIYQEAYEMGVGDFVVPGNMPAFVEEMRGIFPDVSFYSPGLIAQGGEISEAAYAAGNNWHAIIGRAVLNAEDRMAAIDDLAKGLSDGGEEETAEMD